MIYKTGTHVREDNSSIVAKRFYSLVETMPSMYSMTKEEYMRHVIAETTLAQSELIELLQKDYEDNQPKEPYPGWRASNYMTVEEWNNR